MSSFFSSSSYKPQAQVRQEGFHLPSPAPSSTPPPSNFDPNNLFMSHGSVSNFLPDAFRKFPGSDSSSGGHGNPNGMDFSEELASLMAGGQSTDRSTQSPDNHSHSPTNNYDDGYRPHNIFDISAPSQSQSHSSTASSFPSHFSLRGNGDASQPNSVNNGGGGLHDFNVNGGHVSHFNSTLPALNSSMRYEPHPDPPTPGPPPSAFHHSHHFRHSPSPHPAPIVPSQNPDHSRSRSRSRPPSVLGGIGSSGLGNTNSNGGIGPTRTRATRSNSRRNNSVSSTSPPPLNLNNSSSNGGNSSSRPQAILIPGSRHSLGGAPVSPLSMQGGAGGQAWFIPNHGHGHHTLNSPSEYSLPTPDSLTSHSHSLTSHSSLSHHPHGHSHSHSLSSPSHHSHFTPFGLSPPEHSPGLHLPGVSSFKQDPPSNSPNVNNNTSTTPTATPGDKQALLANEKRRRRRESHNAVERRRRDNINEKISELATLIPECMLDPSAPGSGSTPTPGGAPPISPIDDPLLGNVDKDKKEDSADVEGGVVKANKGMILRKSVEYIRYLQQLVTVQGARNRELEQELKSYRGSSSGASSSGDLKNGNGGVQQMGTPSSNDGNGSPVLKSQSVDDMGMGMGMMLHDEGSGEFGGLGGGGGFGGMGFPMGMLATMPEGEGEDGGNVNLGLGLGDDDDMDMDDGEGKGMDEMSPSAASAEGDDLVQREREEEERGRRGRDGRVRGTGFTEEKGGKAKERKTKLAQEEKEREDAEKMET